VISSRNLSTAALVIAAAAGGWWLAPSASTAAAPAPSARVDHSSTHVIERVGPSGANAEELRAIVREELAAALEERGAVAGEQGAHADDPAAPPSEALSSARASLATAIGDAHWSRDERDALRASLRTLDSHDAEIVATSFFDALNRGVIQPDFDGSVF
jgi:hypothetical protein